jgi:hypothetical protein
MNLYNIINTNFTLVFPFVSVFRLHIMMRNKLFRNFFSKRSNLFLKLSIFVKKLSNCINSSSFIANSLRIWNCLDPE